MTTKIAVIGFSSRLQRGQAAQLGSRIRALKEFIPDAEFTVFAAHPEIECKQYDVEMLESMVKLSSPTKMLKTLTLFLRCGLWWILHRCFRLNFGLLIRERRLRELYRSDVVISIGGGILCMDLGTLGLFLSVFHFSFPILLNRPLVIYGETTGPLKGRLATLLAKIFYNRVKLITLREEGSAKELQGLGIRTPIYVTADSAFLLEPASREEAKDILLREGISEGNRPIIGMSVSRLITRFGFLDLKDRDKKYSRYVELMAQVVDYLVDTLNATVVFVPHVTEPWGNSDDRVVADDICSLCKNKTKIRCIKKEYTAEEVKGIIGECDLFVGARMHALTASTSMHVPTVSIAYSRKTPEIMGKMLGQERYVLDIKELDYDTLTSTINDAWNHREEIRKDLAPKIEAMKERALWNAKLVKDLVVP